MILWLIVGVYVLGYLAFWRKVAWEIASYLGRKLTGEDVAEAVISGTIITFMWPVLLIAVLVKWFYAARGVDPLRILMPRAVARRADLDERERKIAALERELGIHPDG